MMKRLLLLVSLLIAAPALAQQPGQTDPRLRELQFEDAVRLLGIREQQLLSAEDRVKAADGQAAWWQEQWQKGAIVWAAPVKIGQKE